MPTPDHDALLAENRARREGRGIFPPPVYVPGARTVEIVGPAGSISLRIIPPEDEPTGTFLHIHGGGWTLGESDGQDVRLQRLARETGLTVVSVSADPECGGVSLRRPASR